MAISLSEYFDLLAEAHSLPALLFSIEALVPDQICYSQFQVTPVGKTAVESDFKAVCSQVRNLANYLSSLGVKKGDRVAICSSTRPEWMIADLAILSLGAISVSIYQTLNEEEMAFILLDSEATILFAENEQQLQKTLSILSKKHTFPSIEGNPTEIRQLTLSKIITFESTEKNHLAVSLAEIPPGACELPTLDRNDLASIVYTSGTTGHPKGVVQTHGNHLSNLFQATRTELFGLDGDIFLFLPLAHSFARLIGYIGFLSSAVLKFPAVSDRKTSTVSIPGVMEDLKLAGANVVPCVPRILEKIKSGIEEKAAKKGLASRLLRYTLKNALIHYHSKGKIGSTLFGILAPIRQKIKAEIFGSHFEHVISGGAKLPLDVCEFFLSLDCTVYQGYGLTETCVATNVNLRDRHKPGSVGPCLYGIECEIAEDGEILFRGPNIALGYWNREQATADAWDGNGFFHTGDLGRLDEDGFLWITGRKKELIVSSTGKKIVPGPIEEKLTSSGLISQAAMFGDERPYCIAVVVPNFLSGKLSATASDQELRKALQNAIDAVNKTLSKHEEIKNFVIVRDEFTTENGLMTPTMKVRKNTVFQAYKTEIDKLYIGH